jgi:hypothetical protein
LKLLYLGCQWKELPIKQNQDGQPEIHYTRIYSAFRRYEAQGCFDAIFAGTVGLLHQHEWLDIRVIHGDGIWRDNCIGSSDNYVAHPKPSNIESSFSFTNRIRWGHSIHQF